MKESTGGNMAGLAGGGQFPPTGCRRIVLSILTAIFLIVMLLIWACDDHNHIPKSKFEVYILNPGETIHDVFPRYYYGNHHATLGFDPNTRAARHIIYYKCDKSPHGLHIVAEFLVYPGEQPIVRKLKMDKI